MPVQLQGTSTKPAVHPKKPRSFATVLKSSKDLLNGNKACPHLLSPPAARKAIQGRL